MRSFRSKVLVSILLTTLVTAAAIAFVFYRQSAKTTEDNYIKSLRQQQMQTVDSMEQMMENVSRITINTSCDKELSALLSSYLQADSEDKLTDMTEILKRYMQQEKSLDSIYLLIPRRELLVTSKDYPAYRQGIREERMQQAVNAWQQEGGPVILEDLSYDGSRVVAYVEAVLDESGNPVAYVQANIGERRLYYDYIASMENDTVEEIVLLDENRKVLTSLEEGADMLGENYEKQKVYARWLTKDDSWGRSEDRLYVHSRGGFSGCSILTVGKRSAVLKDLMILRNQIFGVLGFFLLLSLLPAIYLTQVVYRPLKKLTAAMEGVSEGELTTRAEVVSRDEIGTLTENFNQMLDQIQGLIDQVIREEHEKKDAELQALQYQITPHFMYNTLNSIKFAALIRGEKELGDLIGDFVELLSASISKMGTFLTVAQEMDILEKYIHLQEFRSGGCYCVTYEIGPGADRCQIPRLLLQPLVENAILHGIDLKQEEGILKISAQVEAGVLYLRVADNGRGMTREQIEKLLTGKGAKTKGFTAVGIPNIRDRLKLYYGAAAGLAYESNEKGTTAIIHMPAVIEEE